MKHKISPDSLNHDSNALTEVREKSLKSLNYHELTVHFFLKSSLAVQIGHIDFITDLGLKA